MMKIRSDGYTLMEVMISMGIIIIMLGIVVGTYTIGKSHDTVKSAIEVLTSDMKRVRNMDTSGVITYNPFKGRCDSDITIACKWNDGSPCLAAPAGDPSDCSVVNPEHRGISEYPANGYGIYFENPVAGDSSYTLFADHDDYMNPSTGLHFDPTSHKQDPGAGIGQWIPDEEVKKVIMVDGVTFKFEDPASFTPAKVEIIFKNNTFKIYGDNGGTWQEIVAGSGAGAYGETYDIEISHTPCDQLKGTLLVKADTNAITMSQVAC